MTSQFKDWNLVNENFNGVETNRAILIKVRDPGAVARSQGAAASFAEGVAPAFIEGKVYDEMANQFRQKLAEQHIAADVTVVEPTAFRPAGSAHIASDLGFAVGLAGVGALLYWILRSKK